MTIFLKKLMKTYFGATLGTFCPKLIKNEFSWKKKLCHFLNTAIIYHYGKNQKKLISYS